MSSEVRSFQADFNHRWSAITDPAVRDLAFLLYAPDLLDPRHAAWRERVCAVDGVDDVRTFEWLHRLQDEPGPLYDWLAQRSVVRLGRYAEQLLTYYFVAFGLLHAQGVQVREGGRTLGEFDFLLERNGRLLHRELATKYYLLQQSAPDHLELQADYFVGPNLADTLGRKMARIFDQQLHLSSQPAAAGVLPRAVDDARAYVKGWLFYRDGISPQHSLSGVASDHCRGFWCDVDALESVPECQYLVLPRLRWLAPARAREGALQDLESLRSGLIRGFADQTMPVLVAVMEPALDQESLWWEVDRGFVVPTDWNSRAGLRLNKPGQPC